GSAAKNYEAARDIDILLVIGKKDYKEVKKIMNEKQELLPKEIHSIEMTEEDLTNNIKKRQGVIMDIIRGVVILYGQDKYIGVMKNVSSA
ncbi:hypothetical protein HYX06_01750, partial [Candidatus Woesearchaeota archaeon]|nr:hypothetical protein [Candidatus Woesearchaeota archaeon]